jgi:signal transduction histidine kinase
MIEDDLTDNVVRSVDRRVTADELRRLNWALGAYARSSAALIRLQSMDELFARTCEAIVADDRYSLAWVGLAEKTRGRPVRPVAGAGAAVEYLKNLKVSWSEDVPEGLGPTGLSIRTGEPLIVRDALEDEMFAPWRPDAERYQLRSSVTVPFKLGGQVLGVIVVYASRPNAFGPQELAVFAELAEGLAFATSVIEHRVKLEEAEAARRAAEERARESQIELARVARFLSVGESAASIAHELNQPLAAVVMSSAAAVRWMEADPPNLLRLRSTLQRISADADRASTVVSRIRNKLSRGAPTWSEVDINAALLEAISYTERERAQSQVAIQLNLASDAPCVCGERVELQQVILNLVLNAVESLQGVTGRPRRLLLSTGRTPTGELMVTVEDNGAGLTPEIADRAFEPFFSMRVGGMGLGLSISRTIVERHGGRISILPADETGAIFAVTLPAFEART